MMPTYERRFYLSLKSKQNSEKQEATDNVKYTGKGTRTRKVSGSALTMAMKNGTIPNQ